MLSATIEAVHFSASLVALLFASMLTLLQHNVSFTITWMTSLVYNVKIIYFLKFLTLRNSTWAIPTFTHTK